MSNVKKVYIHNTQQIIAPKISTTQIIVNKSILRKGENSGSEWVTETKS